VVGLAGPSGAGKTELSRRLRELTPTLTVISLDNFLDTSALVDGNFDDPRLTDFARLVANLEDLKARTLLLTWQRVQARPEAR
jgi:uridine kinase